MADKNDKEEKTRRTYGDNALFYSETKGLWIARIDLGWNTDGKRKRWEAASKTRNGALAKLRKARSEITTTGSIPTKGSPTSAWIETWLTEIVRPKVKPGTYTDYRQTCARHITPRIGKVPIDQLTPSHVRSVYQGVLTATSVGNANKVHRVLRAALSDAEREGLVTRNVAKLVKTTASKVTRGSLTTDQAKVILAKSVDDPMHSRYIAALLTGARQGELLGLQWDRVDLDAATIDISWQLQRMNYRHGCTGKGACRSKRAASCPQRELDVPPGFEFTPLQGAAVLTRPKSAKGIRLLPIPSVLVEALRRRRRESIATLNPHGLVWTDAAGGPVDDRKDLAAWYVLLAALELPAVPIHSARHTTATLLMELGVDVTIIQAIMGHSQATTTQAYQHADLTMARKAMDALGESLAT